MKNDYENAKRFWNEAFVMTSEDKTEAENSVDREKGWMQLAPSDKLFAAAQSLGAKRKVLDYGCGRGWGAIIAAKSGCTDVTAVDMSENAAETANFYAEFFGVADQVHTRSISEEWLAQQYSGSYDGIFCSNVLDVIPNDVAQDIITNFARIAKNDSSVIIGMNYYMDPKPNPEKNMTVHNGNCIYINDILRLVCLTDEEWTQIFSKYFIVEKLEHFAWPGEDTERRRLFYLRKK